MVVFLRPARTASTSARTTQLEHDVPEAAERADPAPPRRARVHRPARPGRRPGHPVRPHAHARRAAGRALRHRPLNAPTSSPRRGAELGCRASPLDLVDCPDRRITRAARRPRRPRRSPTATPRSACCSPTASTAGCGTASSTTRPPTRIARGVSPAPPRQRDHRPVPPRNPNQETEPPPTEAGGAYGRQAERHSSHRTRWCGATGHDPRQRARRSDPDRRRPLAPAGHHRGTRPHRPGPTGGGHSSVRMRRRGWHRRDVHHLPRPQPHRRH